MTPPIIITGTPTPPSSGVVIWDGRSKAGDSVTWPGYSWTFDTSSHADANPGTGKVRLNNATPSAATFVYINGINSASADVSSWILSDIRDNDSLLLLVDNSNAANYALYQISAVTNASPYYKLAVTFIEGGGTLDTTTGDTFVTNGLQSLANFAALQSGFANPYLTVTPRFSVVPALDGRSGFYYLATTAYDADYLSIPEADMHIRAQALSPRLISVGTNNKDYLGFSVWLPGSGNGRGDPAFPIVDKNTKFAQFCEIFGPPFNGSPPWATQVLSLDDISNYFMVVDHGDNIIWQSSSPVQYECRNDFVYHFIFDPVASTDGSTHGLLEMWFGANGGDTFGDTLVRQVFPSSPYTRFNSNQTIGIVTASASNWDGSTPNSINSGLYRSPGLSANPVKKYHGDIMLGTTFSAVVPGGGGTGGVPVNIGMPVISGSAVVGQTLSSTSGNWTNAPASYAWQWNRDGTPIGAATNSTYPIVSADTGHQLTVTVVATNGFGSSSPDTSNPTAAVTGGGGGGGPVLPYNNANNGLGSGWTIVENEDFTEGSLANIWTPFWVNGDGSDVVSGNPTPAVSGNTTLNPTATTPARAQAPAGVGVAQMKFDGTNGACIQTSPFNGNSHGVAWSSPFYIESYIFVPSNGGTGMAWWPAFWIDPQNWPGGMEVDIMEGYSGGPDGFNVHYGPNFPNQLDYNPSFSINNYVGSTYSGWHTHGLYYNSQAGYLKLYKDGNLVTTVNNSNLNASWPIPNVPHYVIFQNVNGGSGPVPSTMLVDYCRVWTPS